MAKVEEHPEEDVNGDPPTIGSESSSTKSLRIVIIGAGIGGLTAALALRQVGHSVVILEQWNGANETGAAIHLAPNANGILRRLGIYAETFGANLMRRLTEYNHEGIEMFSMDTEEMSGIWQYPWLLCHRISLHSSLSKATTCTEGPGIPVDLRYSSKVVAIDPDNAIVTTENGERIQGDVLLGADGISSITRKVVRGGSTAPFSSGKSAFRFLISKDEASRDERIREFLQQEGELKIWTARDRKIVMYPCENNKLLNFMCMHPDTETRAPSDGKWLKHHLSKI